MNKKKIALLLLPFLLCGCTEKVSSEVNQSSFSSNTITEDNQTTSSTTSTIDNSLPIVTFYMNTSSDDNTIYTQVNFTANRRISLPGDPLRDNYLFNGWYTDRECLTAYDIKTRPTESFALYAYWISCFTMEAEYVDLDGKPGMGYSANVEGKAMIVKDNGSANASNGYFVSYLYYNGANLEFNFTSEEEKSDVIFVARLSSEFYDIALDDTNFKFLVNDVEITNFYCDLSGALSVSDANKRPFTNFKISESISLKKGSNKIELVVNNNAAHGGTMYAEAPMVDCLYLGTDATLSWTPRTDNVSK